MAKVTFEFDDNEERSDIEEVINRNKIMCALQDLSDLYRQLYNGKIYDPNNIVYITNDNRIAQEEDYKKAQEEGHPLHGKGYYIRQEWLENELNNILQNVNHLLY